MLHINVLHRETRHGDIAHCTMHKILQALMVEYCWEHWPFPVSPHSTRIIVLCSGLSATSKQVAIKPSGDDSNETNTIREVNILSS